MLRTLPSLDEVADVLSAMTSLDLDRLKTRFDIRLLVPPSAEELRNRQAEKAAESSLRRVQAEAEKARQELIGINAQIELQTKVLQALVRASTPPKQSRKKPPA